MSKFFTDGKEPIVVGHGLDNDFKCMQVQPTLVIDTAALLTQGCRKLKLKHLAELFLQIEIQTGEEGHDSSEDARAAACLVRGMFCAYGSE